jgi:hypothetical protein
MQLIIRQALDQYGRLSVPAASLDDAADLFGAGLASFTVVQLMLARRKIRRRVSGPDAEQKELLVDSRDFGLFDGTDFGKSRCVKLLPK